MPVTLQPTFARHFTTTNNSHHLYLTTATMPDTDDAMTDAPSVLFRPSKKRKVYRQRAADSEPSPPPPPPSSTTSSLPPPTVLPTAALTAESEPTTAEAVHPQDIDANEDDGEDGGVVRARNLRKSRLHGVAFRSNTAAAATTNTSSTATSSEMVLHEEATAPAPATAAVPNRFTTATGLTTELHSRHIIRPR
jgi:hypothetical protein